MTPGTATCIFPPAPKYAKASPKHRAGQDGLVMLTVAPDVLGEALKWEVSRGGALFPHLYGALQIEGRGPSYAAALGRKWESRIPDRDSLASQRRADPPG